MTQDCFIKCFLTGAIAYIVYVVCNLNHSLLFGCVVLLPILLAIVHWLTKSIYISTFFETKLLIGKYITFIIQNCLVFYAWYTGNSFALSLIINIFYRLNIIEFFIVSIQQKKYIYTVTGLYLFFFIPLFSAEVDQQNLFVVTNVSSQFILLYTIFFIGQSLHATEGKRLPVIMHAIVPLLFPNSLWFAARTFVGMNILILMYVKFSYKYLVDTLKYKDNIDSFLKIYDCIYSLIWIVVILNSIRSTFT